MTAALPSAAVSTPLRNRIFDARDLALADGLVARDVTNDGLVDDIVTEDDLVGTIARCARQTIVVPWARA